MLVINAEDEHTSKNVVIMLRLRHNTYIKEDIDEDFNRFTCL